MLVNNLWWVKGVWIYQITFWFNFSFLVLSDYRVEQFKDFGIRELLNELVTNNAVCRTARLHHVCDLFSKYLVKCVFVNVEWFFTQNTLQQHKKKFNCGNI